MLKNLDATNRFAPAVHQSASDFDSIFFVGQAAMAWLPPHGTVFR
jgi:hypothetical protein